MIGVNSGVNEKPTKGYEVVSPISQETLQHMNDNIDLHRSHVFHTPSPEKEEMGRNNGTMAIRSVKLKSFPHFTTVHPPVIERRYPIKDRWL